MVKVAVLLLRFHCLGIIINSFGRLGSTERETASTKQEENTCRELATDGGDSHVIIPFGYRFMFHFSILSAIVMSIPSNVKLDKTRWNISNAKSQIERRTPSSSMQY